jgi:hypothetical protein
LRPFTQVRRKDTDFLEILKILGLIDPKPESKELGAKYYPTDLGKEVVRSLRMRKDEEMIRKIFISHSSEYLELAKIVVQMLQGAFEVSDDNIICTSVPGHKFSTGSHVPNTLKKELKESIVLGVLTMNSCNRPVNYIFLS